MASANVGPNNPRKEMHILHAIIYLGMYVQILKRLLTSLDLHLNTVDLNSIDIVYLPVGSYNHYLVIKASLSEAADIVIFLFLQTLELPILSLAINSTAPFSQLNKGHPSDGVLLLMGSRQGTNSL